MCEGCCSPLIFRLAVWLRAPRSNLRGGSQKRLARSAKVCNIRNGFVVDFQRFRNCAKKTRQLRSSYAPFVCYAKRNETLERNCETKFVAMEGISRLASGPGSGKQIDFDNGFQDKGVQAIRPTDVEGGSWNLLYGLGCNQRLIASFNENVLVIRQTSVPTNLRRTWLVKYN